MFNERLPTNKLEDGGLFVTVAFSTIETKRNNHAFVLMGLLFCKKTQTLNYKIAEDANVHLLVAEMLCFRSSNEIQSK